MALHIHPSDQDLPALGPRHQALLAVLRQADAELPRHQALLAVLRQADAELSGQELHERLKQASQRLGLATVYRNLRLLQRSGLVRCRKLPNGESVYAPLERDDHHLTCVDCGGTRRLPHCPVHDLELPRGELDGFLPLFHTLEFYGLCPACQQRQAAH